MRVTWLLCVVLASSGVCQQSSTATASGDFADAVKKATFPFVVTSESKLSGVGGTMMTEAIEQARFVLIGETHFSRETPQFAAAVCKTMHPDAYAVEAGPTATEYVRSIQQRSEMKAAMQDRERRFPASMAFLNDKQESDLAASCTASKNSKGTALWGLDQEFLGAAPVLLRQMQQQANGPRAEAAIETAIERDKQAEAQARSTGDFMQLFLAGSSDAEIGDLRNAIDSDGAEESKLMMHEFAESRRIYRLNASGSPDSNSERADFLKEHFSKSYRSLREKTETPRVLLKFGDNHVWKGFNNLHQLDLGDYVAEVASVEHAASLHIDVLAARGSVAALGGYGRPTKTESFVLADIPDFAWLKPAVAMLPHVSAGSLTGVVLDLRRLRTQHLTMTAEEQQFAYGYDLIVLLPEFTPATFYH